MTDQPRISITFGAFQCDMIGVADPVPVLQSLVQFFEAVEARNPDFGRNMVPLDGLNTALAVSGTVPVKALVSQGRLVVEAAPPVAQAPTISPIVPKPTDPAPQPAKRARPTREEAAEKSRGMLWSRRPNPAVEPKAIDAPSPTANDTDPDIARRIAELANRTDVNVDMPDPEMATALDAAMSAPSRDKESHPASGRVPMLSVNDYAQPRRPRTMTQCIEIAAAYAHFQRGEVMFERSSVLADVDRIQSQERWSNADKLHRFNEMAMEGLFEAGAERGQYCLSAPLVRRFG